MHSTSSLPQASGIRPWWQAAPLTLVFVLFFLVPLALVLMVSFWDFNEYELLPAFTLKNYLAVFEGCGNASDLCVTLRTYLSTLKFCLLVWGITLVLGFVVAYFLAFHVRSAGMQTLLFVLCTIPFWTSMFMIVPIFNSMMRIDRSLLEAANDAGASGWQTLWSVIVPLSRTGIVIGSIFVVTIVMGDFVTIGVMGGQQIASVGKIIQVQTSYLQFPLAAANAVILLAVVLMVIWGLTRLVDIRKEL